LDLEVDVTSPQGLSLDRMWGLSFDRGKVFNISSDLLEVSSS
jgi:hypothetical protein